MEFDGLTPHPLDEEAPGGIVINPHSALGKELRRWEQHRTELVPRGTNPGNPYVFRPYPKMLYRAQQSGSGKVYCLMPPPHPYGYDRPELYDRAVMEKEAFDKSCQCIVRDEAEELIKRGQGWAESPAAALELYEREQQAIGNAAAEAAYAAQRMSATAQAEFAAAGEQTHEHVTDVTPVRKHGRAARGVVAKVGSVAVEE